MIPDGPAAAAKLQPGDTILAIDGARTHGRPLAQIVDEIRGPAGTDVDLFVQRDTEEWHAKLTRATVKLMNVGPGQLDAVIATIAIRRTPAIRGRGRRTLP